MPNEHNQEQLASYANTTLLYSKEKNTLLKSVTETRKEIEGEEETNREELKKIGYCLNQQAQQEFKNLWVEMYARDLRAHKALQALNEDPERKAERAKKHRNAKKEEKQKKEKRREREAKQQIDFHSDLEKLQLQLVEQLQPKKDDAQKQRLSQRLSVTTIGSSSDSEDSPTGTEKHSLFRPYFPHIAGSGDRALLNMARPGIRIVPPSEHHLAQLPPVVEEINTPAPDIIPSREKEEIATHPTPPRLPQRRLFTFESNNPFTTTASTAHQLQDNDSGVVILRPKS